MDRSDTFSAAQPVLPSAAWLAMDTGTEQLSVAVCSPAGVVHGYEGQGAAQSSLDLIPTVQRLMREAAVDWSHLQAIAFGMGPGSFTGLRTACSVAQGLAFGADLPVLPVDSLLAVAEDARYQLEQAGQADTNAAVLEVVTLLDARMGEMYSAHYRYADGRWACLQSSRLVKPEQWQVPAVQDGALLVLAGNVWAVYADALPTDALQQQARVVHAMPTAAAMVRLAPALWAQGLAVPPEDALPLYVRDKVAQTTAERMAAKAGAVDTAGIAAGNGATA